VHGDAIGLSAAGAAALQADAAEMELVPPGVVARRRRAERALAARLLVAAIVLLALAAIVELWGARRQLEAIRLRRAEIRADVAPLLVIRDSIARLNDRVAALDGVTARAPRYTSALFDLAMLLPTDTHLTGLHANGDTVRIEAVGARAGAAIQALRDAGTLRDVRLHGVVERELEDGTTAIERFTLTGRLGERSGRHSGAEPAGAKPTLVRRAP
jgi:hypothetical protein